MLTSTTHYCSSIELQHLSLVQLSDRNRSVVLRNLKALVTEIDHVSCGDGSSLRGLAERHSDAPITGVVIQTAAAWKGELAREAVGLAASEFDFKRQGQDHLKSLPIFAQEALRGEIFQTWMALSMGSKKRRGRIHTWSDGEKHNPDWKRLISEAGKTQMDFLSEGEWDVSPTS